MNIDELIADLESDMGLQKEASALEEPSSTEEHYEVGRQLAREIMEKTAGVTSDEEEETEENREIEKAAAVSALVESGIDYDTASLLVKEAADEIEQEEQEAEDSEEMQIKMAAVELLVEDGMDLDEAVEIVKEAGADEAREFIERTQGAKFSKDAVAKAKAKRRVKNAPAAAAGETSMLGKLKNFRSENPRLATGLGAAGLLGAGAAGMFAYDRSKQAALEELMEEGFDFDEAAEIVKEASITSAGKNLLSEIKYKSGRMWERAKDNKDLVGASVAGGALAGGTLGMMMNNREKQAALEELMEEGFDFDEASEIVKEAAGGVQTWHYNKEGRQESSQPKSHQVDRVSKTSLDKVREERSMPSRVMAALRRNKYQIGVGALGAAGGAGATYAYNRSKQAALDELMEEGFNFDDAIEIVKEAAGELQAWGYDRETGRPWVSTPVTHNVDKVGDLSKIKGAKAPSAIMRVLRRNKYPIAAGAAGLAGGAGAAYAYNRSKQAALDELMEEGFEFEDAVEIIKEAADKVYYPRVIARKEVSAPIGGHEESAKIVDKKAKGFLASLRRNKYSVAAGAAGLAGGAGATYAYNHSKKAALDELMEEGFDFDEASEIVKEAADGKPNRLVAEAKALGERMKRRPGKFAGAGALGVAGGAGAMYAYNRHKKAALDELMEEGFDFDEASEIVKEAAEGTVPGNSDAPKVTGVTGRINQAGKWIAAHKIPALGLVGAAAAGTAGGIAYSRSKRAALDELLEAGVDFDEALDYLSQI